jgi:hypothetical protein
MIFACKYSVQISSMWADYRIDDDDDVDYMQRGVIWEALKKLIDRVKLLGDKEFKGNFKIILMAINLYSRPPGFVIEDCTLVQTVCMKFTRWWVK